MNWRSLRWFCTVFFWTIPSIFNWRFTKLLFIWSIWKLNQLLEKSWGLVECVFLRLSIFPWKRYIKKNLKSVKHEFCTNQVYFGKADANFWNHDVREGVYGRIKKFYVKFPINRPKKQIKNCFLFHELKWAERRILF